MSLGYRHVDPAYHRTGGSFKAGRARNHVEVGSGVRSEVVA